MNRRIIDTEMQSVTGAILIGGRSERMGEAKHLMKLPDGRRMIDVIVETLSHVCTQIVLLGRGEIDLDLQRIVDLRPQAGPLVGIEALLASGIDEEYLVCPCDVPLVTSDLLTRLLNSTKALATVFQIEGRRRCEPLPARIHTDAFPVAKRLLDAGELAVWRFMEEVDAACVEISESDAAQLRNVNTPSDFHAVSSGLLR